MELLRWEQRRLHYLSVITGKLVIKHEVLHLVDNVRSDVFLFDGVIENSGMILRLFQLCRIMKRKEVPYQVLIRDSRRIIPYPQDLNVIRLLGTHVLVSGLPQRFGERTHETYGVTEQARTILLLEVVDEPLLSAPVTTSAERGHFLYLAVLHLVLHGTVLVVLYEPLHFCKFFISLPECGNR